MTYTTLTGAKTSPGSIMNWVSYSKLDTVTILDEAQSLLFQMLRVREMHAEWMFSIAESGSQVLLPARFLDPDGDLISSNLGQRFRHVTENQLGRMRAFENATGTLGTNAITVTQNSLTINVNLPGHDLTIASDFTIAGAATFNGVDPNLTYKVVLLPDADNITLYNPDMPLPSATGAGGGAAMTYIVNRLVDGSPSAWAVGGQLLMLDCALTDAIQFRLSYFKSPLLLSATNQSNWLTDRYPRLLRTACQASAADFMKDDAEYQKCITALGGLIQSVAAENDLMMRGLEFGTDTP